MERCVATIGIRAAVALLAGGAASLGAAQPAAPDPVAAQVAAGKAGYAQNCAVCHGAEAGGGQFAPTLKGAAFVRKWQGPIGNLYDYIHDAMPPANAGGLPDETYAAILAYLA